MAIAATRIMAAVLNNLSPDNNQRPQHHLYCNNLYCGLNYYLETIKVEGGRDGEGRLYAQGTEICVSGPLIIMPGVQITGAQILVTTPVFSCSLDFSPNL